MDSVVDLVRNHPQEIEGLSIPLNGFHVLYSGLVNELNPGILSIPLNGFVLGVGIPYTNLVKVRLSIPLNGFPRKKISKC